ncbi:hypothetical protein ACFLUU_01775 [Chloroflexota bacterium]
MDYRKYYQKTTVGLSQYTKETLGSMKKVGQTYDGLVRELIVFGIVSTESIGLGEELVNPNLKINNSPVFDLGDMCSKSSKLSRSFYDSGAL